MSFVFQSGEFYNTSSTWQVLLSPLATLIGVLISGAIVIVLFNMGLKRERHHDRERRETDKKEEIIRQNEKIQKFSEYVNLLVASCIKSSKQQVNQYIDYIDKSNIDFLLLQCPLFLTHENLKRLQRINQDKIHELFEYKLISNDDFIVFYNELDYLSEIILVIHDDVINLNGKTVVEQNNSLISIRTQILSVATKYLSDEKQKDVNFSSNNLWSEIDAIVHNYLQASNGIPNARLDYEKLIIPLKSKLLTNEFRDKVISVKLLDLAKNGGDIAFAIRKLNEQMVTDISIATKNINISIDKLIEINKKIK